MQTIPINQIITELYTLRDVVRWGASQMNAAGLHFGHGTTNAWEESLFIALHQLHLTHDDMTEVLDARLTQREKQQILKLIQQRVVTRIPAPYLTQQAWFAGMPFYVDQRVIIPRSPLAEIIERHFSPWCQTHDTHNILDLCTGSACMAIASALAMQNAKVDAVDLSPQALQVAAKNVQDYQLNDRIHLIQSDLFTALGSKRYDIIISNPPYVGQIEMQSLPREYHYEPRMALASGADGLDCVRQILQHAPHYLNDEGILMVEVGNSAATLIAAYPQLPFVWLEFERGGEGVFLLHKDQLKDL